MYRGSNFYEKNTHEASGSCIRTQKGKALSWGFLMDMLHFNVACSQGAGPVFFSSWTLLDVSVLSDREISYNYSGLVNMNLVPLNHT